MPKTNLITMFTKDTHVDILNKYKSNEDAAKAYNDKLGWNQPVVYRQIVSYWRKLYTEYQGKKGAMVKQEKEFVKLIQPSPTDDIGDTDVPAVCKRILVVGDLHAPYTHPDAIAFLRSVRDSYSPDMVVQVGDETDGHAISFHDSDVNLDSAGVELEKAKLVLEQVHTLFPNLLVCDSNHGSLIYRRAKAHGLPVQFIKKYRDILFPEHGAKKWSWADAWVLNTPLGPVRFQHQVSGDLMLNASHERTSLVIGHHHAKYDITYSASSTALYFGAHAGCLVDNKSLAFAYGKLSKGKPIMGVMTITDGCPSLVPMLMDSSGRWVGRKK